MKTTCQSMVIVLLLLLLTVGCVFADNSHVDKHHYTLSIRRPLYPKPMSPALRASVIYSAKLTKKANLLAKTNPAAAIKLYEKLVQLDKRDEAAILGIGDCKERITGNPKSAVPYYYHVMFVMHTGIGDILPPVKLLKAALLFKRAGDVSLAVKLYDRCRLEVTTEPNMMFPYLNNKATASDVACLANVGLGLDNSITPKEQRAYLEKAVAIKKSYIAQYYLNQHRQRYPELNKVQKPSR